MKGFLLSILVLVAAFYFIHQSDSKGGGEYYAAATGQAFEVTAETYDHMVTHSEAPVLAYYWAPW